jgi:hypothetical protein
MCGFVYIWHDKKRNKFCIGSHVGTLDDGYVTSTGHMKRAFKQRPHTFKRRILSTHDNTFALREAEQRWLSMIKDSELGIRYYNLKKTASGGNGGSVRGMRWKWSKPSPLIGRPRPDLSEKLRGRPKPLVSLALSGRSRPSEVRLKISMTKKGTPNPESVSIKQRGISVPSRGRPGRPKVKDVHCVHCDRFFSASTFSRWHGKNCKAYR